MKKFLMLALVFGSFSLVGADITSAAPIQAYSKPAALYHALQTGEISRTQAVRSFVPQTAGVEGRRSTRSYSYVPGSAPAPVMRRSSPTRVPSYMLPKSDPRRYNGF